ncbi:MAG: DNA repair protein RadA [Clostridia bacterium]|nr:DNA repair protein RadA [Clostridia bacterium]
MAQKQKISYVCDNCGYDSIRWYGQCPSCKQWDSLKEFKEAPVSAAPAVSFTKNRTLPKSIDSIDTADELRFGTGFTELDRVLGGGAVRGSIVLIGGEPGIGKSTLMLQICHSLSGCGDVLYASGEESQRQIKLRADRLGVKGGNISVLAETNLDLILDAANEMNPAFLIVDSVQTVYRPSVGAAPGNVTQIKECTMALLRMAKDTGTVVFIVGHVNKDGEIAGPKILEHMVDCVLYFEGEKQNAYRILRAAKNRFGSTNEIGVFEMLDRGLAEITNPSEAMLAGRPAGVPGTCITAVMEGTRPILAEVQALVSRSAFGNPRRMASGVDYNRAVLLLAVLETRAGLLLGGSDAYVNVIGGLKIEEPAADLATVIALASSFRDLPVVPDTIAIGEVGLTGELRRVHALEQRISEAARMKFKRCICPYYGTAGIRIPEGIEVIRVQNIPQALDAAFNA